MRAAAVARAHDGGRGAGGAAAAAAAAAEADESLFFFDVPTASARGTKPGGADSDSDGGSAQDEALDVWMATRPGTRPAKARRGSENSASDEDEP